MVFRIRALSAVSVLVAAACSAPAKDPDPDAGTDSGLPLGACTSPCGPNQTCDAAKHVCVDACQGLCLAGQICVNRNGTPTCEIAATTCSGSVCGEGQISCVADHCSCLPFSVALRDSCADQGGACHQIYNAVRQEGGACEDPRLYEFCAPNCAGGTCAHHCGAGQICTNIITGAFSICARTCSQRPCASGELCAKDPDGGSPVCLLNGAFPNQGCTNTVALPDGGTGRGPTVAGDLCFQLDLSGTPTEAAPTGTCSWVLVTSDAQSVPVAYCRSPGPIARFGACQTDVLPLDTAGTCATGLECVPVGRGNEGICLPPCNAALVSSGASAQPSCPSGESCVNFHRFSNSRSVLGACMSACSVFSTEPNYGCPPYGTKATSCVPTSPSGVLRVSLTGEGICAPQLPSLAAEGDPCGETDAFRGAACQSGLACVQLSGEAIPRCVKPCDVECGGGSDAGVPDRCATEANARCTGGRTCVRTTGTTGAIVGFCL